jgi:hypothetical protein
MFTLAVVIYIVAAILFGPLWPLELISGKAGVFGVIIASGWLILLIGGLVS